MRNAYSLLACLPLAAALLSGCSSTEPFVSNPEPKFGRGMANAFDIVRGGEFRRTMEQTALFDGPDAAYTHGFIRGINRTFARTGIGIFEMVTAPFPPHHPIATDYLAPGPVYPDSYMPNLLEDSMFATDTSVGFSGGDVLPMIPGSRFHVFDTH
jgi:putative exosortase-associated protein (TIGR04073 family)